MALGARLVKYTNFCAAFWIALCSAPPAFAQADLANAITPVGEYTLSEMELVAGIRLNEDGTFEYGLTVGSLDEWAKGRWTQAGGKIELTNEPRPVAPTVIAGQMHDAPGQAFAFRLLSPNGNDVPAVDFSIDFDNGDVLQGYTNGSPWNLSAGETRTPRFVTFSMPAYRLHSGRLPLEARAGRIATFTLIPNDFGVADLTGVVAELSRDALTLHRPEGIMRFRKLPNARD